MPLLKKVEYRKLCNITAAEMGTYITRGKIVMTGPLVNTDLPENRDFLAHRLSKQVVNEEVEKARNEALKMDQESGPSKYDIEKETRIAELERKRLEIRLNTLKEQRLRGDMIPMDLVRSIFAQHSKSIMTEFKNAIEDVIVIVAKKKAMTTNDIAWIRGQLTGLLNGSVDKAVESSAKSIKIVLDDMAEKRGRGERK